MTDYSRKVPASRRKLSGMTLVEIMAALVIIGLAAGIFAQTDYFKRLTYANINAACRKLGSFITEAQAQAVLGARELTLVYDIDNSSYWFIQEGEEDLTEDELDIHHLPSDITFAAVYTSSWEMNTVGEVRIQFRRDGAVTPHVVQLTTDPLEQDPLQYTLKVSPLTGYVEIFKEPLDWVDLME